jgi:hypothetical protein
LSDSDSRELGYDKRQSTALISVTDEVAASSFEMHPKHMMPFFPVNDALGVNLQMVGNLPKGNYEGVWVNAIA